MSSRCCASPDIEPKDGEVKMNPMVYQAEMAVYCSNCGAEGVEVFVSSGYRWGES